MTKLSRFGQSRNSMPTLVQWGPAAIGDDGIVAAFPTWNSRRFASHAGSFRATLPGQQRFREGDPMTSYEDSLLMREARERYFADNGFSGRYDERWVKLEAGPIPIWFPNTRSRVRAVKLHDLHHLATGYSTHWRGEVEIGGWEIASGCGSYTAAWILNLGAFAIGLILAPRRLFRAFVRGRRSRNLFRTGYREALLETTVGALRTELRLDRDPGRAGPLDVALFALWVGIASLYMLTLPVGILLLLLRAF